MNRNKIADSLEKLAEELREEWPPEEIYIPINTDNLTEEDWEEERKVDVSGDGILAQMPDKENDFPCHECGGRYGPWIKKSFWPHDYASFSENPSISLGLSRVRRCHDCGNVHFNCYSMGEVTLEVDEKSGHITLDSVI